jgi:hypothetical protein
VPVDLADVLIDFALASMTICGLRSIRRIAKAEMPNAAIASTIMPLSMVAVLPWQVAGFAVKQRWAATEPIVRWRDD